MNPSYVNSDPIIGGAEPIGSIPNNKRKRIILFVVGVVFVLLIAAIFIFITKGNNAGKQENVENLLNKYSNYLLYGTESSDFVAAGDVWPADYYQARIDEKDKDYINKLENYFGAFSGRFFDQYTSENFGEERNYDLVVNLINSIKLSFNYTDKYFETGEYSYVDGNGDPFDTSYSIRVSVIDESKWLYDEIMEKKNGE